jgi:hypothetical protein
MRFSTARGSRGPQIAGANERVSRPTEQSVMGLTLFGTTGVRIDQHG